MIVLVTKTQSLKETLSYPSYPNNHLKKTTIMSILHQKVHLIPKVISYTNYHKHHHDLHDISLTRYY